VGQDSAKERERLGGESRAAVVAVEDGPVVLDEANVEVETASGLVGDRLRHEGGREAPIRGGVPHDVLPEHEVIGSDEERFGVDLDLLLPGPPVLVVVVLHRDSRLEHARRNLVPEIEVAVRRRDRLVAALGTDPVGEVLVRIVGGGPSGLM